MTKLTHNKRSSDPDAGDDASQQMALGLCGDPSPVVSGGSLRHTDFKRSRLATSSLARQSARQLFTRYGKDRFVLIWKVLKNPMKKRRSGDLRRKVALSTFFLIGCSNTHHASAAVERKRFIF